MNDEPKPKPPRWSDERRRAGYVLGLVGRSPGELEQLTPDQIQRLASLADEQGGVSVDFRGEFLAVWASLRELPTIAEPMAAPVTEEAAELPTEPAPEEAAEPLPVPEPVTEGAE